MKRKFHFFEKQTGSSSGTLGPDLDFRRFLMDFGNPLGATLDLFIIWTTQWQHGFYSCFFVASRGGPACTRADPRVPGRTRASPAHPGADPRVPGRTRASRGGPARPRADPRVPGRTRASRGGPARPGADPRIPGQTRASRGGPARFGSRHGTRMRRLDVFKT